jgi:CHAT domain-containing protein
MHSPAYPAPERKSARLSLLYFILPLCLLLSSNFLKAGNGTVEILLSRGHKAVHEGRIADARQCLKELQVLKLTTAQSLNTALLEAGIMHDRGRIFEAMTQTRSVIDACKQGNYPPSLLADAYIEYARCCRSLLRLEHFNTAMDTLKILLSRYDLPRSYRLTYHTNKAIYYSLRIVIDRALAHIDTMMSLAPGRSDGYQVKHRPHRALSIWINLKRNYHFEETAPVIDSIMKTIRQPAEKEDPFGSIMLWRAIGNFWNDRSQTGKWTQVEKTASSKALASFDKALELLDRHFPENHAERITLLNLKGLTYYFTRDYRTSLRFFQNSEAIMDEVGYSVACYTYQHEFTAHWQLMSAENFLQGKALTEKRWKELHRWQEIAKHWEAWQQINFRDSLKHSHEIFSSEPDVNIAFLCHGLYEDSGDPSLLDTAFAAMERSQYSELRKKMTGQTGAVSMEIPGLKKIREGMGRDEAIIRFVDTYIFGVKNLVMVISKDTTCFIRFDASAPAMKDLYLETEEDSICKNLESVKRFFHQAYDAYFLEIEKCLSPTIRKLTILPSANTIRLNFGLLIPDTTGIQKFRDIRYLKDRYLIRYDFSWLVSELRARLSQIRKPNETGTKLVFNPDYTDTKYYRLPFMDSLSATLADRFGFIHLNKGKATVAAYRERSGNADILHFSGHAFSHIFHWADQQIVLDSMNAGDSRYLNPYDIIETETNASMVVLSICNGGLGPIQPGGIKNLMYWFTYAGVRSCVYAYWKLDDHSTSTILERFYFHLSEGMDKSDALAAARNDYFSSVRSDEELNPIYWGGLIAIGDDMPVAIRMEKKETGTNWPVFLIITLITVTGTLIYLKRDRFQRAA